MYMLKGLKQLNVPEMEEKVLRFWKDHGIFEQSLAQRKPRKSASHPRGEPRKSARRSRGMFVFYEGPPTANGMPGIHHVLTRAFKDVVLRYKTMRGFFVPRRGGWDTHGLPVEIGAEKQLGLNSKKEIEQFGVAAFNKQCRESVWKYKDEWERLTERMGFWLDFENAYVTYHNDYIEKVWGMLAQVALRQAQGKPLLYKGHHIVPWCTRCGTGLSTHELGQPGGYKEVTDTTAYVKFKVKRGQRMGSVHAQDNTFILAWTTTPWTLPGNVALAVGKDIQYGVFKLNNEQYIIAEARKEILGEQYTKIGTLRGRNLVGIQYTPIFDVPFLKNEKSHRVYAGDFVTTTEGTGVVHIAPMYGEDDYALGKKAGLPQAHTVDVQGKFTSEVKGLAGLYAKGYETGKKLLAHLETQGSIFKTEPYVHEYPHCWRCGTALLYYARDSWYIAMSTLRNKLLKENKGINWIPSHIKEGRFGEWLREAKDWAVSRERYWGTPLPIWVHGDKKSEMGNKKLGKKRVSCENVLVAGSLDDLNTYAPRRNRFFTVRHTEATHILDDVIASGKEQGNYISKLTPKGLRDAKKIAKQFARKKIDIIYTSPYHRTKQMAQMIGEATGVTIIEDARLGELNHGIFNGGSIATYRKLFKSPLEEFTKRADQGEHLGDAKKRMVGAMRDINEKHDGKNIVVISHGHPLWAFFGGLQGVSDRAHVDIPYPMPGDVREVAVNNWPFDDDMRLDVHRPYIDDIILECPKCGDAMRRVPEVADVWLDSGCMPFASIQNKKLTDYPADFITEGIDQTRGWFYTLLAVAVLLGKKAPYKNVISLGLIHDKFGQKMSKSKGNVVDPWEMIKQYGIDAVRWYFYTVNPPGEPKHFDEKDIQSVVRQFIMIVFNCYVFFDTYADPVELRHGAGLVKAQSAHGAGVFGAKSHVLDRWVVARLHDTTRTMTAHLDAYEIGEAARTLSIFIDDLSRWYIRRSRRRFQRPDDARDYRAASETLGYVLLQLSKLIAPFTPFFAEGLYRSLINDLKLITQSVHLEDWMAPNTKLIDVKLLSGMEEVRRVASLALAERAKIGIKVRQPLQKLKVKSASLRIKTKINEELLSVLAEEVNVKQVVVDMKIKNEIEFDIVITPELRAEGILRDFGRIVQGLRQEAGYEPKHIVHVWIHAPAFQAILQYHLRDIKNDVGAKIVEFGKTDKFDAETSTKLEGEEVWVGIKRV